MEIETFDDALVDSYLGGDEDAFSRIIERHLKSVYNLVHRITGTDADAEDAAQDTFLKAWRSVKTYKKGRSFRTWLLRIAHNTAIDLLRKRRDVLFSSFESDSGNQLADSITDSEPLHDEVALKNDDIVHLNLGVLTLNPSQQEILTLHYQEHLTFKEIGEILGKPLDTVKSQHQRAVHALREHMDAPNHRPQT